MRENMNVTLEEIIRRWELSTNQKVTDQTLETPDFIKVLLSQEWQNIKDGKYSK